MFSREKNGYLCPVAPGIIHPFHAEKRHNDLIFNDFNGLSRDTAILAGTRTRPPGVSYTTKFSLNFIHKWRAANR
jgi:hypothetical protein